MPKLDQTLRLALPADEIAPLRARMLLADQPQRARRRAVRNGPRSGYYLRVSRLALPLPATDLAALRFRIRRLAPDRPGTYRMLDAAGRVLYIGKARSLRRRLLSYFSARFPDDKQARILHASSDIRFDPAPGEFVAALTELDLIRRHRPPFNVAMNRNGRLAFLAITSEPAPRLIATRSPGENVARVYGPYRSPGRLRQAARLLTDLLGLRDCSAAMPLHFGTQGELFLPALRAACPRYDFGTCLGPCAGLTTGVEYQRRVETAAAFLEGRTISPMDTVIDAMSRSASSDDFERALFWRSRFESLEWLLSAMNRTRSTVDALTFVYHDPGFDGDARAHLIVRGNVLASYPDPTTPIEREAFRAVVRELLASSPTAAPADLDRILQQQLVASWFRRHQEAWRRVQAVEDWQ